MRRLAGIGGAVVSAHTPGPWSAKTDPCHYDTLSNVVGGELKTVGGLEQQMMVSVGGWASWQEQEANARLIAAAPDLLEALKRLKTQMVNVALMFDMPDRFASSFNEAQAQADSAIAKAEGKS